MEREGREMVDKEKGMWETRRRNREQQSRRIPLPLQSGQSVQPVASPV